MNKPFVIFVAGIPAAGKTVYAGHLAEKLGVPCFSKDAFKEKLHEVIGYDTALRENSRLYGNAAYHVCYYVAEAMMKAGVSFVLESNFTLDTEEPLAALLKRYRFCAFTVLADGKIEVIHKRFLMRDQTEERHPGLVAAAGVFDTLEAFQKAVLPMRAFSLGERFVLDTTDFSAQNEKAADNAVLAFINDKGGEAYP